MRRVAFDLETHLIRPGMIFPKIVCCTISDGQTHSIYLARGGLEEILRLLQDPDVVLIGHNVSYDLGCIAAEAIEAGYDAHWIMELIFGEYAANRIVDTMVRAMLVAIAQGKFQEFDGQRRGKQFSLDMLALTWLHRKILKQDTWRLHYAALENVPLADWPPDATHYAITDAEVTWLVDEKISQWAVGEGQADGTIPDEYRQVRAAWVLHLAAGWGVRVDEDMVKLVRENLEAQRVASYGIMEHWAIFKKDKYGDYKFTKKGARQKDLKRLRALIEEGYKEQGESPPLTDGGKSGNKQTKTSADAARDSGHVGAIAYADVASAEKLLSTYVPILERGKNGRPVTSSPNVLVASGRTSWTNPNWQNPPRVGGIRECVIPRGADYEEIEVPDDYVLQPGELACQD